MLWELRAETLPGSNDSVLVEMRQVPGYLDFLAEIMPADVRLAEMYGVDMLSFLSYLVSFFVYELSR